MSDRDWNDADTIIWKEESDLSPRKEDLPSGGDLSPEDIDLNMPCSTLTPEQEAHEQYYDIRQKCHKPEYVALYQQGKQEQESPALSRNELKSINQATILAGNYNPTMIYDYAAVLKKEDDSCNKQNKHHRYKKSRLSKVIHSIYVYVMIFITAFLLLSFVKIYFFRMSYVSGSSMQPTLTENDRIYSSMLPYLFDEPQVGDIVIIDVTTEDAVTFFDQIEHMLKENPMTNWMYSDTTTDDYWIKRVVGVAGDVLEFRNRRLYRNGELVIEDYLKEQLITSYQDCVITVEEGYVFVMGDNRNISRDSRYVGQIPITSITGKYLFKK